MNVRKRLQYYTGCSGWSYTAWKGPFYPSDSENSNWLKYYSHIFNYVEIDSSFYNTPNIFMVNNWNKKTPKDFKFTAKFPKVITHEKRLKEVDEELVLFFEAIGGLSDKILALLIQLPPSLQIKEGLDNLRELVPQLDNRFRYAIEVRHRSWFQDLCLTSIAYLNRLSNCGTSSLRLSNPSFICKDGGSCISKANILSDSPPITSKNNTSSSSTSFNLFSWVITLGNFAVNLKSF